MRLNGVYARGTLIILVDILTFLPYNIFNHSTNYGAYNMAFSKDPEAYTSAEQQILIEATTRVIEIPCVDTKQAAHVRHRLYALKRCAIDTWDKAGVFKAAGKPFEHLLIPVVKVASGLRSVTIGMARDKKTLYVGQGAASNDATSVLEAALKNAGFALRSEEQAAQVEAFGKIDFSTAPVKEEDKMTEALNALGYGTGLETEKEPVTTDDIKGVDWFDKDAPPEPSEDRYDAWVAEYTKRKMTGKL